MNTEQFIQKATKTHGNKYNYNQVNYINNKTKIQIYCNTCKQYFKQSPSNHLYGFGCTKCNKKMITKEQFIQKATKTHGNKYNYNQIEYINKTLKISIYCNTCKQYFKQKPSNHLNGHGCSNCAKKQLTLTKKQFIQKATKIHNNKYNYNQIEYKKSSQLINIYCNTCKQYFQQTPNNHLAGHGCPNCAINKTKITKQQIINKANKIHLNKYNYKEYDSKTQKLTIQCNKCSNTFKQSYKKHIFEKQGCPKCAGTKLQKEIYNYIQTLTTATYNTKQIITPQELDIWIPSHNLAIECNGNYWHNEKRLEKTYHHNKYQKCKEKQITLIQIYETEWYHKPKQIQSYIKTKLNQNQIIKPNECNIITLNNKQYNQFQNQNTILTTKPGNTLLGLQHNNQLIATINIKENTLLFYTELLGYTIPGGLNKLLQHHNKPITYNDNLRYTIKEQLTQFTYIKTLKPDYQYTKNTKLYPKYYYPKHKFKNYNPKLTPTENMANNKYYKLWDAGYHQTKWDPEQNPGSHQN